MSRSNPKTKKTDLHRQPFRRYNPRARKRKEGPELPTGTGGAPRNGAPEPEGGESEALLPGCPFRGAEGCTHLRSGRVVPLQILQGPDPERGSGGGPRRSIAPFR